MSLGVIKWYDPNQGFGYILDSQGTEIYFHYTAVADRSRSLSRGVSVAFDLITTRMGCEAANVRGV